MAKITEIEGIGSANAEKLAGAGIKTVEALLTSGAKPGDRKSLAEKCDIPEKSILRWVNMADLFRIKGVGEEYADLLEAAGVDTVVELAQRNAENLHTKMTEVNEAKSLVRALPSSSQVADWVGQAKDMDRAVFF